MTPLFLLIPSSLAIVGYICSPHLDDLSSFSLKPMVHCNYTTPNVTTEEVSVQVLRPIDRSKVKYKTCLITRTDLFLYCGVMGHLAPTDLGLRTQVIPVTKDECDMIHDKKIYRLDDQIYMDRIVSPGTYSYSGITLGSVDKDYCHSAEYYDSRSGRSYQKLIRQTTVEIMSTSGTSSIDGDGAYMDFQGSKIPLARDGTSLHPVYGGVFPILPTSRSCPEEKLTVLFQGRARLATRTEIDSRGKIKQVEELFIEEENAAYLLTLRDMTEVCGFSVQKTDFSEVYVSISPGTHYLFPSRHSQERGFSLATYVDTKITLIRHSIRSNVDALHRTLQVQLCNRRAQDIYALASLARTHPEEFAYRMMQGLPGYQGYIRGDLIYIGRCQAVVVTVDTRHEGCYKELAVIYNETRWFLSTHSRMLLRVGTEVDCLDGMPTAMITEDGVRVAGPRGVILSHYKQIVPPGETEVSKWTWVPGRDVERSGLFTAADASRFTSSALSGEEVQAAVYQVSNSFYATAVSHPARVAHSFLGSEFIDGLADSLLERLGSGVTVFGTWVSAAIGIMAIAGLALKLVDLCTNGLRLSRAGGRWYHFFLLPFDAALQWFLHQAGKLDPRGRRPDDDDDDDDQDHPMIHRPHMPMMWPRYPLNPAFKGRRCPFRPHDTPRKYQDPDPVYDFVDLMWVNPRTAVRMFPGSMDDYIAMMAKENAVFITKPNAPIPTHPCGTPDGWGPRPDLPAMLDEIKDTWSETKP